MGFVLHYGSIIIAPALGGTLYYVIGLLGILLIDVATFCVAIATVLFVSIYNRPAQTNLETVAPRFDKSLLLVAATFLPIRVC